MAPGRIDVVANGRTGSGKTVCLLNTIAKLGVPALVIVPNNKLRAQWLGSHEHKNGIRHFFGDDFFNQYVGVVQQELCDYEGRLICVGLLPSLVRRDYGVEFYRHFGAVFFDEAHTAGAPILSEVLKKFPARVRAGVTATNREDSLKKVIELHLGTPRVVSEQEVLKPVVFVYQYDRQLKAPIGNSRLISTRLAGYEDRQDLLTKILYHRGFLRGRQCVGLSDRVLQLQNIRDRLLVFGVPSEQIGLHVGMFYTGKITAHVELPGGKRKKLGDFSNRDQAIAAFVLQYSTTSDYRLLFSDHKEKIKESTLEVVSKNCSIILGTYGSFGLGTDIPRIDFGVELTPRGRVTQAVGRVLRLFAGKPQPEWYTIDDRLLAPRNRSTDVLVPQRELVDWSRMRLRDYQAQSAIIKVVQR